MNLPLGEWGAHPSSSPAASSARPSTRQLGIEWRGKLANVDLLPSVVAVAPAGSQRRKRTAEPSIRWGFLTAALLASGFFVASCRSSPPPPDELPRALAFSAKGPALRTVFGRLDRLQGGTPLATLVGALEARVGDCAEVWASCPAVETAPANDPQVATAGAAAQCSWVEEVRCVSAVSPVVRDPVRAVLETARGDADLIATVPVGAQGLGVLRAWVKADGSLRLTGELRGLSADEPLERGPAALLLPGETPPGPGVLSTADALLQVRLRPRGGLDIARLVTAGSGGDRLFRLKSQLFTATTLRGTWELALYSPTAGQRMMPLALGLDVTSPSTAKAAMEMFLGELTSQWPLARRPFTLAEGTGECLGNVDLLPELMPCYVTTANALVIGWNEHSVRRAVAGGPRLAASGESVALVDLERIAAADLVLAASRMTTTADSGSGALATSHDRAGSPTRASGPPPWRRLQAHGRFADGVYHLTATLTDAPGSDDVSPDSLAAVAVKRGDG